MEAPQYHLSGVVRARTEEMEDFNGPLDLILLLLSKNKVEIEDISISDILDQYLAYLDEQKRMDIEIASEFITMASHLMLIKTKMLLSFSEQQEALSEMQLLIQSLTERRQQEAMSELREAIPFLEEKNGIGLCSLTKEPEPVDFDQTYRYQHSPEDLLRAFALIADRQERAVLPAVGKFAGIVGREPYPIGKKAMEILRKLTEHGRTALRKLFAGSKSRSEIVAGFLALLELCRRDNVSIDETDKSGEPAVTFLSMPDNVEDLG